MSKPKSDRTESLLAAIQRKAPTNAAAAPLNPVPAVAEPAPEPRPKAPRPATESHAPASRAGKPAQFWLHDEDRRLVRELAAWLNGQGERVTDSLVIRAVLRVAKTGPEFLKAYRQLSQQDGRLKPRKTA